MNISGNELQLYQRSKDFLWTDPHISQQMLKHHLDLSTHAASRDLKAIEATLQRIEEWINPGSSIVDLGCGPGLYAERLYTKGFHVTGVDISESSLAYARTSAREQGMAIDYHQLDYLVDEFPGSFDVALCIYADFGALTPSEQEIFLTKVAGSLREEGILIFDVFNEAYSETQREERTWHYVEGADFWTAEEHLLLHESVYFPEARAWGTRDLVVSKDSVNEFITWDTLYDKERIEQLLAEHGFVLEAIDEDVLTDSSVMFVKARRI